jgi:hypothetical protein
MQLDIIISADHFDRIKISEEFLFPEPSETKFQLPFHLKEYLNV